MKVVVADIKANALNQTAQDNRQAQRSCQSSLTYQKPTRSRPCPIRHLPLSGLSIFSLTNAGVGTGATIWESSLSDWQSVLGADLWGVIHGIHNFVPQLIEQDTEVHIVNTSSIAGLISNLHFGVYAASKHAIVALSETLAMELAARKSKINASVLCPNAVRTNVAHGERNRRTALHNAKETAYAVECMQGLRKYIRTGKCAAEIADLTFNAICEQSFYIITHPETLGAVEARMDMILMGLIHF
jgi:NAD(P)-dependent dehydrogenase (short-subunit alcohol dehydrogenase family)